MFLLLRKVGLMRSWMLYSHATSSSAPDTEQCLHAFTLELLPVQHETISHLIDEIMKLTAPHVQPSSHEALL